MDVSFLVPAWVIQDLIVFVLAVYAIAFILKREPHPQSVLMEFLCFTILYAAVYENFAVMMGWYGYGKSLIMIGNVPLSVPIVEYLVVYSALRMLEGAHMPTWCKPIVVGFMAMMFDFSLDPIAVKLLHTANGVTIGRWSWYPAATDVQIYGEPVYNFTGWVLICGYAACLLLLGRWWFKKSKYNPVVGTVYPIVMMVAALAVLVGPESQLLLWLGPFYSKGSNAEWIMLGFWVALPAMLIAVFWRGRMRARLAAGENVIVPLVLAGLPVVNIVTTLVTGMFAILWLVVLSAAIDGALVLWAFLPARGTEPRPPKRP